MRDIDIIERLQQIDNAIMQGQLVSARAFLSELECRLRDHGYEPSGLEVFLEAQAWND